MAHDRERNGSAPDLSGVLGQFQQEISRLRPRELRELLQHLLAAGSRDVDRFTRPPMPSRRRPRRDDVVTYRVRIDLKGTRPPLWRRLELASDLFLDELHDIIQTSFGWTDTHLHRFGSGTTFYSAETEYYFSPVEVEQGEAGVPEDEVRLDEVLAEVGDRLFYTYDFGDDWEHVIKLEAVLPRDGSAPRAVCTGGRRPGPPEDCGGVGGYEAIVAARGQSHSKHAGGVADLFGDDVDPDAFELTPFDAAEINEALFDLGLGDFDE